MSAPTPAPLALNVAEVLETRGLGRFQLGAFALLGACLVMDGFDVLAMGYAAPALIRDWGLSNAAMGPVFGAALLGLFLGSILSGVVADRVGRRPVLLTATLAFSLFTLLTAHAGSMPGLLAARFAAGLGLGAMMPNATALVGEYSPRRHRVATMMIVTNGFMVGAVLGGFLSAWLVPAHGWRSVFTVGGVVPLALLLPMARWLPESLEFLAARGDRPTELTRWLARVDPAAAARADVVWITPGGAQRGISLAQLFRDRRAVATALLWLANFTNVLDAYLVASWLPTVVSDSGRSTSIAVLVGTAVQVGGMLGTFALGLLLQRLGFTAVLFACFAGAAANLAVIGEPGLPLAALVAFAFLTGWGVFGGQPGLNALAATFYPVHLRSTGIGAALGVGRLGAVLGPLLAAELLRRQWSGAALFQAAAVPAVVSALAVLALHAVTGSASRPPSRRGQARSPPQ